MRMTSKFFVAFLAIAAVVVAGGVAQALTMSISGQMTPFTDESFGTVADIDLSQDQPGPVYLTKDFYVTVDDLGANQRYWAGDTIDITLTSGLTDLYGWVPDLTMIPKPPAGPAGDVPMWDENLDLGDPDLQGVTQLIVGGLAAGTDARTNVAGAGPVYIGTLYLQWDGTGPDSISVNPIAAIVCADDSGLLVNVTQSAETIMLGDVEPLGPGEEPIIPEPASITLLGLAMIGLIGLRRR